MENEFRVIGLMSGTSLDGVDLAACAFRRNAGGWQYELLDARTIAYSSFWRTKLEHAHLLPDNELKRLDTSYGKYLSSLILAQCREQAIQPRLIASHGHTVFHAPEKGISLQIGSGKEIATLTGVPVVCDFRSLDVAKGGQGAPLVPVGDKYLFGDYDACLNLGGFSNISMDWQGKRIAFDICPVNIILNYLAREKGKIFDDNGDLGRKGKPDADLLEKLNSLEYYHRSAPKSLAREWLEEFFLPLVDQSPASVEDKCTSLYHHITCQIIKAFGQYGISNVLVTGGGAHNQFLLETIQQQTEVSISLPEQSLIDYKEAIIFAFLGLLRYRNEINCFASVTGASEDSITGVLIE